LNKQEGLLPGSNQSGQQDEKRSIRLGASRSFYLPMENVERFSYMSGFCYELGLASAKVCERPYRQ